MGAITTQLTAHSPFESYHVDAKCFHYPVILYPRQPL